VNTKTKIKAGENVIPPSGLLKDAISKEELEKNFTKYIDRYAHLYENADELKHFVSTKATVIKKGPLATVTSVKMKNGATYTVIGRNSTKKAVTPKVNGNQYEEYQKMMSQMQVRQQPEQIEEPEESGQPKSKKTKTKN
jgi:hypothetical protein